MSGPTVVLPVAKPISWPRPPEFLSFSSASEVGACPRRWGLMHARYNGVWARQGYPGQVNEAALEGTIIHNALSSILKGLTEAGCISVDSAEAPSVLRQLGGYSTILRNSIQLVLAEYEDNPRVRERLPLMSASLEADIPDLRLRLQALLRKLDIQQSNLRSSERNEPRDSSSGRRRELTPGFYSEVRLVASSLGWHGVADLLSVSESGCAITDFKTGEPKEEHARQLLVYALLWFRDKELNPRGTLTTSLVASYEHEERALEGPSRRELEQLSNSMEAESAALRSLLTDLPPEARPSEENCRTCQVRHLCTEYWSEETQRKLHATPSPRPTFSDIQIRLLSNHGPTSWNAETIVEGTLPARLALLLRSNVDGIDFGPGQIVRILGIRISDDESESKEDRTVIGTITSRSEVFLVI